LFNRFVKDCKKKYDNDLRFYKESLNKCYYDKNILENKLEKATNVLEDQALENRFDKMDICLKGSTIEKLKVSININQNPKNYKYLKINSQIISKI
jgi:hypothetical protein